MNNGWIKIHRKLLDWEWYNDTNTFRLFFHCLLMANHKDKKYRGTLVKRGEFLTGLSLLSEQTGLTVQQVRTCLTRLISTNEITKRSSSQGTRIQVVNYHKYQLVTNEITNEQQTNNKRTTTNKNDKNIKNNNNNSNIEEINVEIIDVWIKQISTEQIYLEGIYRTFKLEHGSAYKLLNNFKEFLKANPTKHTNIREFKRHFYNWVGVKERNNDLKQYKRMSKGML